MPKISISPADSIGERRYLLGDEGAYAFTLRFGRPQPFAGGSFRCDFEFIGQCEDESIFAVSVDEISAIDSAFWMAGSIVQHLNESKFGGRLRWIGAEPGRPIGLPVFNTTGPDFRNY